MRKFFLTVKLKTVIFLLVAIFVLCGFVVYFSCIKTSVRPTAKYTVVVDAGHGGIDGGSVGINTNIEEKEINLKYAYCLKDFLEQFGFDVVLTRKDLNGLYQQDAPNKKRSDMQKRKEIIKNANADFVISIHMNSFPDKTCHGAEVYYNKNSEESRFLAGKIQSYFVKELPYAKSEAKAGDFFMVEDVGIPACLVECGYLSNPEEEALLVTTEYMKKVCNNILLGVLGYLV